MQTLQDEKNEIKCRKTTNKSKNTQKWQETIAVWCAKFVSNLTYGFKLQKASDDEGV